MAAIPRALPAVAAALVAVAACSPGSGGDATTSSPPQVSAAPWATDEPRPAPRPSRTPALAARLDPFDAGRALEVAHELAALGPRPAGSDADAAARDLLEERLTAAGWSVEVVPFPLPQGGTSANVVARRPGAATGGPYVVIGGHLDTVAGSPGANDNASGIGVLVALAEELADESPAVPVAIVGFGAEEYQPSEPREHHLGSDAYAEANVGSVVAALVVDMVGNGDLTCICWLAAGPDTLAIRLASLAPDSGYEVRARGDISDHGPFAHRGVPAALLWTGRDGRYHSPADTAEHLRVEDLRRAGALALAFVRDLDSRDRSGLRPGDGP